MTQTARVAGLEELLTLLPYLLGYHPTESLVVIGVVDGRRLGPVERIDLPAADTSYPPSLVDALSGPLVADGVDSVVVVAFGGTPRSRGRVLAEVSAALADDGLEITDRLAVSDGRWWSVDCRDPGCCPPGGRLLPSPQDVPAVAEFVGRGVAPFSDRAALVDHWGPGAPSAPNPAGGVVSPAGGVVSPAGGAVSPAGGVVSPAGGAVTLAQAIAAWESVLGRPLGGRTGFADDSASRAVDVAVGVGTDARIPAEAAVDGARLRALAAAADPHLRDEILGRLCPGLLGDAGGEGERAHSGPKAVVSGGSGGPTFGVDDIPATLGAMATLARRAPASSRYDVLAMAATVAWWHGDGTAARVCAEEVVRGAPEHTLGRMLCDLIDAGVRPGGCR